MHLIQFHRQPFIAVRLRAASFALGLFCLGDTAFASPITNVIPAAARPLPLSAVRLTGGPLKNAQDLDAKYLLALEPDRMLAGYRLRAGLEPKAKGYGGWDAVEGKQLTGHIGGHYLSAVSLMYAATGDPRFKERADDMVKELQGVQDRHGDGYLGALANGRERFAEVARGNIRSGGFDLNGLWVAVIRAAQNLRRSARCLAVHRQLHRTGTRNQVRRVGRGHSVPAR